MFVAGETMPPTPDRQLKFIRDVPFRNTIYHPGSSQSFSVPLTSIQGSQWTSPNKMPRSIKNEIDTVLNGIFGKEARGLRPDMYRFCWYASMYQHKPATAFLTEYAGTESLQITIGMYVHTLDVRNYT